MVLTKRVIDHGHLVVFSIKELLRQQLGNRAGVGEWNRVLHREVGDHVATEFFHHDPQFATHGDEVGGRPRLPF